MADPLATALAGMPIAFQKRRRDKWAPRQSFAETLLKQGSSTAPVGSWGEGLARAGQGLLGGVFGNWYERQEDTENQTKAKTLAEALASGDMDKITAAAAGNPDLQDVAVRMAFAKALDKYQRDAVRQQAGAAGVIPGGGMAPRGGPTGPGGDSTIDPNNIGNIRDMQRGGFRAFASPEEGVAAAIKLVQQYPQAFNGGKPMTLLQVGERWAPKGDGNNDPAQWARNIAQASGLPVDQPLDFSDPRVQLAFARGLHVAEKGTQFAPDVYMRGVQMASGAPATSPAPGLAGGAPPPSGAPGLPPSVASAGSVTGGWSFSPISSAQAAPMPGQPNQPMPPQAPPQVPGVPNPPPAGTPPTTPVPPGPPQASPNLSPTMPFADFYGQGDAARAALDALNKGGGTVPGAMMAPQATPPQAAPVAPVQAPGGQLRLGPNGEIMAGDQPIAGPVQAPPPLAPPAPQQAPPQAPPGAPPAVPPQVQQYSQRLRAEAQRAQQTAAALAQRGDPGWQAAADQARKLALEADKFDAEYGLKAGKEAREAGKQAQEMRAEQAQAGRQVSESVAMMQRMRDLAAEIEKSPDLGRITGIRGQMWNIPGGPGANLQAKLDALKSQISISVLQTMRDMSKSGGAVGQVTEKEWPRLEAALAALAQTQDEGQFRQQLGLLRQQMDSTIARINDAARVGGAPMPSMQPGPASAGNVPPPPPGFTVQGR